MSIQPKSRLVRRTGAAAVVLAVIAVVALLTGAGNDVTRTRLQNAVAANFANEYVRQATDLNHSGVTVANTAATAACDRGGPAVADVGPGATWICTLTFRDQTHAAQTGKFEVNVHANSCYTVGGPSKLIGLATITDRHENTIVKPVSEFDGCFDPDS